MSTLPAPAFGPIGKEVFERTYSRVKENGENETWEDTVRRVVKGNTELVESRFIEPNEQDKLFDLIYNFKMVPAGRHLWVSGVEGRQFVANCFRAPYTEKLSEHNTFVFDELMKGGGVGANYSNRYIDKVQPITNAVDVHVVCSPDHPDYNDINDAGFLSDEVSYMWDGCMHVDDSREGWVEALALILDAATGDPSEEPIKLAIDISEVRPRGSRIRGFGGVASGPLALADMLVNIHSITNNAVGRKLTTLEHMQIDHRIAQCVVAGNVRRSARMSIKTWSDPDVFDFIECKLDWSDHWSTNISVEIDDEFLAALKRKKHPMHDHASKVYKACVAGMLENGEPGFYNVSLASEGEYDDVGATNPCLTGDTWVLTTDGPRQITELVGQKFTAVVENGNHDSTDAGFFPTGVKETYTLNTSEGYKVNLTKDHRVLTPDGWVEAGDLIEGDSICVGDGSLAWGKPDDSDTIKGYVLGHLIGDGTFGSGKAILEVWDHDEGCERIKNYLESFVDSLGHRSDYNGWKYNPDVGKHRLTTRRLTDFVQSFDVDRGNKTVTNKMEQQSSEFIRGVIQGLFDTDGHVEGQSTRGGVSIRLTNTDVPLLQSVQRMLSYFGIKSSIRTSHPEGRESFEGYSSKASFRLIIAGSYCDKFMDLIGFRNEVKSDKYYTEASSMSRGHYNKPHTCTFTGLTPNGIEQVFDASIPGVNKFEANGLVVHNCGEIPLAERESCILGHVNISKFFDDFEGSAEAFRLMTRFLVRATFADKTDEKQKEVVSRNRKIGVGFFGFQGWLNKQNILYSECASNRYVRKTLRDWKKVVDKEADRYAHMLRIPSPIKRTTLAPTGSISQLSGDSASAQTIYSPYFKRRVRFADNSDQLAQFEGTHEIEDCLYTSNTKVVTMYVKDPLVAEVEALGLDPDIVEGADDLSISDMLGVQAMLQECYVDNAISFTINVAPDFRQEQNVKQQIADGVDEAAIKIGPPDDETVVEVMETMLHYLPHLKGTTIMVDGSRPQAPLERISKGEFESYELAKELGQGELACSVNGCPVK